MRGSDRVREYGGFTWLGWLAVAVCVLAIVLALGLVFKVF